MQDNEQTKYYDAVVTFLENKGCLIMPCAKDGVTLEQKMHPCWKTCYEEFTSDNCNRQVIFSALEEFVNTYKKEQTETEAE